MIANQYEAEDIYEALAKARGIQELMISIGWDINSNDLGDLALAITNTTIHQLIVHVSRLKMATGSDEWDETMPGLLETVYWFEPIVCSLYGRAQPDENPTEQVHDNPFSSQWESFRIDGHLLEGEDDRMVDQMSVLKEVLRLMLLKLKSLTIRRGTCTQHVSLSLGEIVGIDAQIFSLGGILEVDRSLLLGDCLTRLSIKQTPKVSQEPLLRDFLRQSPKLSRLSIGCNALRALCMIDVIVSARKVAIKHDPSYALRMFELQQGDGSEGKGIEGLHGIITCRAKFTAGLPVPDLFINVTMRHENSNVFLGG